MRDKKADFSIDTHFKINRHTGIDHIPTITMHFILCFRQNLVIYIGFLNVFLFKTINLLLRIVTVS